MKARRAARAVMRYRHRAIAVILALAALSVSGCFLDDTPAVDAAGIPVRLEEVASGLAQPVFATAAPGTNDLFIVEQRGTILRQSPGGSPAPWADVSERVRSGGEQGLLGLAFHPSFAGTGRFHIHYNDLSGDHVVAEHNAGTPSVKERLIFSHEQPESNHNGGMLAFGPDGFLYIGLGDGGGAGDPDEDAQDKDSLLGKILRLDVDGTDPAPAAAGNPFVRQAGADEVWAYGLRNPWRFSFDRETGDLWIADVGQRDWEEIDLERAPLRGGQDYGWNTFEGTHRFESGPTGDHTRPVYEYKNGGERCSVTGGYVYRGSAIPALVGQYVFGDYCSGEVWALKQKGDKWRASLLLESGLMISSFGEDAAGELLVVDHGGSVQRIVPT